MLHFKPLPFVQELQKLPPDQIRSRIEPIAKDFVGSPMGQLLAHALQQRLLEALNDRCPSVDYTRGVLVTLDYVRGFVWALLPDPNVPTLAEAELSDGIGEPFSSTIL